MEHGTWNGIFVFLLFVACSPSKPSSPTLATVNDEKIALEDFQKAMEMENWKFGSEMGLTQDRLKQLKTKVVESLLKNRLLLQEASRRHIQLSSEEVEKNLAQFKSYYSNKEDFEKLLQLKGLTLKDFREQRVQELKIKKLMEEVAREQVPLSTEDLKQYYDFHPEEFKHSEQVHARQIVTDSKEKGEALRKMLVDGISFEETAKKYSLSPDRKQGGDLGWFGRGEMPIEFDQVCFHLKAGELSPVVKTPYGYHLFLVLENREAGQLPFDEVKDSLQKKLMAAKGEGAFQKWYEGLRASAQIEVHTELLEEKRE